jgi:CheY-like chemotaxis protein
MLKHRGIFIVEDNLQNRTVFQMALTRHGARVNFERCGRDTMSRLRSTPGIDLIVLDLMLADGVTGFQLYEQIRALSEFDSTPIVAASSIDPSIAMPRVRAMGFNAFISKPIDVGVFPKQLVAVMAGDYVWDSGRQRV